MWLSWLWRGTKVPDTPLTDGRRLSSVAVLPHNVRMKTPFQSERLDHVAIVVTDVTRAVAFYRDVLGLVEIQRPPTFDFPGAWLQIGLAGQTLHLLGLEQSEGIGRRHFCMLVDDLAAAEGHITKHGHDIQWHTKHKIPGIERFFVHDPDGNRVELQGSERRPGVV